MNNTKVSHVAAWEDPDTGEIAKLEFIGSGASEVSSVYDSESGERKTVELIDCVYLGDWVSVREAESIYRKMDDPFNVGGEEVESREAGEGDD